MVLFISPCRGQGIQLGMVISVFKGAKAPKLHPSDVPISSCIGFRVLQLEMEDEKDLEALVWTCSSTSTCLVVRLEALVSVLDCEQCASAILSMYRLNLSHDRTCHASNMPHI